MIRKSRLRQVCGIYFSLPNNCFDCNAVSVSFLSCHFLLKLSDSRFFLAKLLVFLTMPLDPEWAESDRPDVMERLRQYKELFVNQVYMSLVCCFPIMLTIYM